jgi:putative peptidoglycan lipid II flippase
VSGDEQRRGPPPSGPRRRPDPRRDRYAPDELTGEVAVPIDMFGLAVESPGVAQQPLAPWMTGEQQAISLDEPPPYLDEASPGADEPPAYPVRRRATRARAPGDHEAPAYPRGAPGYPDQDRADTDSAAPTYPHGAPAYPDERAYRGGAPTYPDQDRAYPGSAPTYPDQDRAYPGSAPTYPDERLRRPPPRSGAPPRDWPPPAARPGAPVEAGAEPPTVPPPAGPLPTAPPPSAQRGSLLVAAGILLSRCAGLIREVVIGALLGTSPAADAFKAALRIPNLMQNLLGEGVLSASFIPVYARLRAEGREREAGHLAGAIAGLLAALTGAISLVGVVLADPLTSLLVPGFTGAKHDLTVELTRIMFPGIGFLVLSAWCLGVLNSHRKFFLSYVAPVVWNVAQIAALVAGVIVVGGYETAADQRSLAVALSWGVLVGGVLQFGVQLGPVRRLLGSVRLSLDTASESVRSVIGRFVPVVVGRGAIQIMGWIDLWLASYLVSGAISSLTYAMVLYLLPVSLFGVSVAAAELPDMSQVEVNDPDTRRRFRLRLEASMGRIAWYVAFTATMFIVVGDVIVAAVFEWGSFDRGDTILVWLTLAVLSVGLLPVTASRLLQNGLYALDDPRTPARLGVLGVVLSAVIGVAFMFPLDRVFVGVDGLEGWGDVFAAGPLPADVRQNVADVPHLGIVGLAIGASVSRWIEYRMLSNALAWRVGRTKLAGRWLGPISVGCAVASAVAFVAALLLAPLPSIVEAVLVVGPAGLAYLAVTHRLGVPEALATADRLRALARGVRR